MARGKAAGGSAGVAALLILTCMPASSVEPGLRAGFRRIWADSKTNALGAPSPDGRYLSFVDWETGDLAVRDLATGENHRLTNKGSWRDSAEYAYFSIFSPDSRQVAYAWFNEKKFYELRVLSLEDTRPLLMLPPAGAHSAETWDPAPMRPPVGQPYRSAVRGSPPRVLFRNEEVQFIKPTMWSSDGRWILALIFGRNILNQIVLFSAADGSVRVLKSPFWIYPKMMGLSPDGRWVVYSLNQEPPHLPHDIYLLATDGSRDVPLVEHPANDTFPLFAPDGRHVLFLSNRTGTLDAWLLRVEEDRAADEPVLVKKDMGRFLPLGFTDRGAYYYAVRAGDEDAYMAVLEPESGRIVERPRRVSEVLAGVNSSPDFSPDGEKLAFLSRVDTENHGLEQRVITIRRLADGSERQIGVPKLGYLHWLRWSPDGRAFLVGGADTANNFGGLYLVDAENQRVSTVVQGPYAPPRGYEGAWMPDGKGVVYVHDDMRENFTTLRFRDLATGQERLLHRTQPFWRHNNLAVAPDGSRLAFGLTDGRGPTSRILLEVPVAGGEPRELLKLKKPEITGTIYTRDGAHLLFARGGSQGWEICRLHPATARATSLGLAANETTRMALHPDGRRLAYTAGKTQLEVWVMDNFLPAWRARR